MSSNEKASQETGFYLVGRVGVEPTGLSRSLMRRVHLTDSGTVPSFYLDENAFCDHFSYMFAITGSQHGLACATNKFEIM
jgi:hypothetical protein